MSVLKNPAPYMVALSLRFSPHLSLNCASGSLSSSWTWYQKHPFVILVDRTHGGDKDMKSQAATDNHGTTNASLPQEQTICLRHGNPCWREVRVALPQPKRKHKGQPHFPWSLSAPKAGSLWKWDCPVSGYLVSSHLSLA